MTASPHPPIAVVVPTLGGGELVGRLAESFQVAATAYPGRASLVVCDASSRADAVIIAAAVRSVGGRYIGATSRGASAQRNQGAAGCDEDVILFIDSDCVLDPGLLVEVARGLSDDDVAAIAGRVEFFGPRGWVFRSVHGSGVMDGFEGFGGSAGDPVPWGPTANFAIRRREFDAIGGFDEGIGFPRPGGEDVDLGLRLTAAGGTIRYLPTAIVQHPTGPWDRMGQMARRFAAYGRGDVHLMHKHPELAISAGPNLVTGAALAWSILVFGAIIRWSSAPLAAIPIWMAVALAVAAVLAALRAPAGERGPALLLALLFTVLDGGRFVAAVRERRWRLLAAYPLLDPKQLAREWPGVLATWAAAGLASLTILVLSMIGGRT